MPSAAVGLRWPSRGGRSISSRVRGRAKLSPVGAWGKFVPAGPLKFRYTGIEVRDLSRSLRFYRGLGYRVLFRGTMGHGGEWVHLRLPHQVHRLELNWYPRGSRFRRPYRHGSELDHLGFRVDDPEAWAKRAQRFGGRVVARVNEPHEWLVYVSDPDGIWLEFIGDASKRPMSRTAGARKKSGSG